jgi:hypothetical protein
VFCCLAFIAASHPAAAACDDFPAVRAAVDKLIKTDPATAAAFQKEVKSGGDSLYTLEQMADAALQARIDACRFEIADHLTKQGYPPGH